MRARMGYDKINKIARCCSANVAGGFGGASFCTCSASRQCRFRTCASKPGRCSRENEANCMQYPCVQIYPQRVFENASLLRQKCLEAGVSPVAVIKGFHAHPAILAALQQAGYTCMASARLPHLQQARAGHFAEQTMLLRLPMLSEVEQVVELADISLNSELSTLQALSAAAQQQGKTHQVILMRDLGDLREGVWERQAFYALAEQAERLPHLHLLGIGANLSCYGSVIPSVENLSELAEDAAVIGDRIGRPLEVVSGGSTSTLPLLLRGALPAGINQLRLGEALVVPYDLCEYWQCPLPGLRNDALLLQGQIVELGRKPSVPVGQRGRNAFGNEEYYEDRGVRLRAIVAMGVLDFGDAEKLLPLDEAAIVLGASSDHLLVDVEESREPYQVGQVMTFALRYRSMLQTMVMPSVAKQVCTEK